MNRAPVTLEPWILGLALSLGGLGLVMVGSASINSAARELGDPFYYLLRQGAYLSLGAALAYVIWRMPLRLWQQAGPWLVLGVMALLLLVLIPGLGREVNHARRWLGLGVFNLQVSELAKLAFIIYLAGYVVRRGPVLRTSFAGFATPLAPVALAGILLLLAPDFGAAAVLAATALGLLFLAGARLSQFGLLLGVVVVMFAGLAVGSPYRLARLTTFIDPWADPFDSGFQLTQSLIAFGRGEWFGAGLGASIQKLFYLPEAHTDFVYAILAEELGLLGAWTVIVLYVLLVWRAFGVGTRALRCEQAYGGYLCYGIGLWLGLQAFINMGVNMGVLPTKGLTLPLMSYGGSSVVVNCMAIGFLLRVHRECETAPVLPDKGQPA